MTTIPEEVPTVKKPRRRWWQFFVQFSLRSLLVVTTLAAALCWWFLQPPTREELVAGKHLKLRRQVKLIPREKHLVMKDANAVSDAFMIENVGAWRLLDEHGDPVVVGRYQNDVPHGKWTIYHTNGRKAAEGSVVRGAKNGLWRVWDAEGRLQSEVTYQAVDQRQKYFAKGVKRANTPWVALRHGPVRVWYPNAGLKFEGHYVHDRKDGRWIYYDEQGNVTAQGEYWRNVKEGRRAGAHEERAIP